MLNQNPLRAALWMSCAVLAFSFMAVAVRELLRHMGAFEILFLRTLVTMLLVGAVVARAGTATLRTRLFRFHLARGVDAPGRSILLDLRDRRAHARDRIRNRVHHAGLGRVARDGVPGRAHEPRPRGDAGPGPAGIAIILRPAVGDQHSALGGIHPAALVMVLGSVFYAGNMVMTKRISMTDSPLAVLFWMSLTQLPLTFATALPQWVTPKPVDLFWAAVIGSGSFVAHYSMTRAMKLGDATLVVPIDFLRLPLIAVVGAVFYREPLQAATFAGAAVIFAGTYYSLSREARRAWHIPCGNGRHARHASPLPAMPRRKADPIRAAARRRKLARHAHRLRALRPVRVHPDPAGEVLLRDLRRRAARGPRARRPGKRAARRSVTSTRSGPARLRRLLRRQGAALRRDYAESLRRRRGIRPDCSRVSRRSCSARMISIAFSNTARGGPDLPLTQIAT
jgi:drug/metabolite transporter (DMT)-like permease